MMRPPADRRSTRLLLFTACLCACAPATARAQAADTTPPPGVTLPSGAGEAAAIAQPRPPALAPALPAPPPSLALPTPASEQRSAWRDLFTDTWSDTRRFPSRETMQWLAIGTIAAGSVSGADTHWGRSIASVTSLTEPLEPGAVLGSTPLQLGLSAMTYGVGRASHSPRMTVVGADLFRAQLLAQGLTMGMKASFRRRRPEGGGFAFPSGHTTVSFASATVLQQHFGWGAGIPAYALASYVALSRVQMKRHYLSDVAFGAALGIAAGRTVAIGRERRLQIAAMPLPGGGGVQFTWVGRGTTPGR